jgi:hypothetical protein
MAEQYAVQGVVMTNEEMVAKEKSLDLKLKELEVTSKEYEQTHRPGILTSSVGNPAAIAAAIAAWASLSASLITWQSGQIASSQQAAAEKFQREAEERKFEANLITEAVKKRMPIKLRSISSS